MAVLSVTACSCTSAVQELSTYWENHDFASLEAFDDIDTAEDRFDGYMELLGKVPHETAVRELTEFLDSAARNEVAYMVWSSWFEPYLHALESPFRNDALFEVWLDRVLTDGILDDYMTERLQQIKDVMKFNLPGQPAADVRLQDADGSVFQVSELKEQRTLLMLLDANCPSCLDHLNENLKEYGREDVRLVAVLVNGSPMHIRNISSRLTEEVLARWTLAWCPGREIEQGQIYDLTLIPSRIMLDSENIVEKSYY